jgi:hypothetical protein
MVCLVAVLPVDMRTRTLEYHDKAHSLHVQVFQQNQTARLKHRAQTHGRAGQALGGIRQKEVTAAKTTRDVI